MVTLAELIAVGVVLDVVVGCVVPSCLVDPDALSCVAPVGIND